MKTKKIVIGTMAAAMLSISVCSLIPASAAGETVQIIAGNAEAKAGEQFTVEVTLADIPTAGIQACDFSIEFDNSVITVDEITAGSLTETGIDAIDPSASVLPNFNSFANNDEGFASVMWSTSVDDNSYWLKGEGVLCVVKGTVAKNAAAGASSELKIVPVKRSVNADSDIINNEIDCGSLVNGEKVAYAVATTDGSVKVADEGTPTVTKRGDANLDGNVDVGDVVRILQALGNPDAFALTAQGKINADTVGDNDGVTGMDAIHILEFEAGLIDKV